MPTPVAKGIIISVAALVAAGIAVYESPQFRRWVNNSRRKLAMALHNLGDEIHPGEANSPFRQDISMAEEIGPEAEERRRISREELQRRRSILERRQIRRANSSVGTFDTLVDENGRLLDDGEQLENSLASSTAVDLGTSQPVQRGKQLDNSSSASTLLMGEEKPRSELDGMHISIPAPESRASSAGAAAASADDVYFTTASEVSDGMSASIVSQALVDENRPRSASSSSHTEGGFSDVIYAHPESVANGTTQPVHSPFSDLEGLHIDHDRPSTPPTPSTALSTSDSYSHISVDASSDGTISELGGSVVGAITPASWSEVGSEISDDDHHHNF